MSLPRYEPMLATAEARPFSDDGWSFELKVDGVRLLLYWDGERVELRTRRGREVSRTYPELTEFSASRPCIVDGEVVVLDEDHRPSFGMLQRRMNVGDVSRVSELRSSLPVTYVVFDVLYDGAPLLDRPIEERRARLAALPAPSGWVRAAVVAGDGDALWSFVQERDLEGMVAKRNGSRYVPGVRTPDWRKVANRHLLRAVVGGFTSGEGGRADTFGSLVLGLWGDDGLRWIGTAGSGFADAELRAIRAHLDEMTVAACPFAEVPDLPGPVAWVEPHLVAVVEYKEWTGAGRLRAPVWKGFSDTPHTAATWAAEGPGS